MNDKVFIYWDNSNIYISACQAAERCEGRDARFRARMHFPNLLSLARANRDIGKAYTVGSVPPELQEVWTRMKQEGVEVNLQERGQNTGTEQGVDAALQAQMLRDALDNNGNPGIVVLLTGDGKGFYDGVGFHADIERMHRKGWRIEVLSWRHSCNTHMREWVERKGLFVALDDFYECITYLKGPSSEFPADGPARAAADVDLSKRATLK